MLRVTSGSCQTVFTRQEIPYGCKKGRSSLRPGYGGLRPPWGQSLLRSCLAARSFPPPPPANGCALCGHLTFRADPVSDIDRPSDENNRPRHLRV